jgi:hypothetical protein
MDTKVCSCCELECQVSSFYKDSRARDGLYSRCKACHKATTARTPRARPKTPRAWKPRTEQQKAANRESRAAAYWNNRDAELEKSRAWRAANPDAARARDRMYRVALSPEVKRAYDAVYYAVKAGALARPSACPLCESSDGVVQAHHEDYAKPLDVVWACKACHEAMHHRT